MNERVSSFLCVALHEYPCPITPNIYILTLRKIAVLPLILLSHVTQSKCGIDKGLKAEYQLTLVI